MVFANVEPVQAAAPITGLVASAQRPTGDGRWVQGMSWVPERCGFTTDGWSPCETHRKAIGAPPGIVDYMPPGFSVGERCTTLSERDIAEAEDRVRRQTEAATSYMVAQELWAGAISRRYPATVNDAPYINPYLADGNATDIGGTYSTARAALAALEAEALKVARGQRVFLHVSPEWVPHLGDSVRRQGNLLLTNNDSVVVADGGYPGTGDVTGGTSEVQNVALSGGTQSGTSEVQTIDISGSPTGGTFTLTYDANTTAAIAYNATAADVQAALEALPNVAVGDLEATGGPLPGSTVTITFQASLGNVSQITGDGTGLTGGTTPAVNTATTTEGVAPIGGTFTLTLNGETTEAIPAWASTTELQDALAALPSVEPGDVEVSGTPGDWNVTFDPSMGDVPLMTDDDSGLTGGSTPTITVTQTTAGAAATTAAGLWAYATGPVEVRLTDVEVLGDLASQIDRTSNRREVTGERIFAATFDPCIQLKVQTSALS